MTKTSVLMAGGSWSGTYSAYSIQLIGALNTLYTSAQEVRAQTKMQTSLTLRNLYLHVASNTVTTDRIFSLRKNAVNANLQVTVPASMTGTFEDILNNDTVVQNDLVNLSVPAGTTGSTVIGALGVTADHADTMTAYLGAFGACSVNVALTRYFIPTGQLLASTTEEDVDHVLRFAATVSFLRAYVYTNTISVVSTGYVRKNAGVANGTISIPGLATGSFVDVTHSDSFVAGDSINYQLTTGAAGTSMIMSMWGAQIQSSDDCFPLWADGSTTSYIPGYTYYWPIAGQTFYGTEVNCQSKLRTTNMLENLFTSISANSLTVATTIKLRVDGVDGAQGISIPGSSTGEFEDNSNTDMVTSTTLINYKVAVPSGGAGEITVVDVGVDASATVTRSDTGSGADTVANISVSLTMSDTGVGTDSLAGISVSLTVSDANAAATEVWTVAVLQTFYDVGSGMDAPSVTANVTYSDTGAGADVWTIQGQILLTDTGTGVDVIINITHPITDSGILVEAAVYPSMTGTFSDSAVAIEVPKINFTITDSGALSAEVAFKLEITPISATDSGTLLSEAIWTAVDILVQELVKGAEFAWRQKGLLRVDDFEPPHVLSIKIADEAKVSDQKIEGGTLPQRKMRGKIGRTVEITGWTESQSDIAMMEALSDGATRVFQHPCGDSFSVIVVGVHVKRSVQKVNRRDYTWTLGESIR